MDFAYTDKVKALQAKVQRFMDDHVYTSEQRHRDDVAANRPGATPGCRSR